MGLGCIDEYSRPQILSGRSYQYCKKLRQVGNQHSSVILGSEGNFANEDRLIEGRGVPCIRVISLNRFIERYSTEVIWQTTRNRELSERVVPPR